MGKLLAAQNHDVYGLRRKFDGAGEMIENRITPLTADITRKEDLEELPGNWDWVVNTVSSSRGDSDVYSDVFLKGTRNLIDWLSASPPNKYVYTSSTSVYGQNDGSFVVETSPTVGPRSSSPSGESTPPSTAQTLVEAENTLLEAFASTGFPAVILRLSGIYGPERGHLFKQFLAGKAEMWGDNQRFLNMVHRDDAAAAIVAALQRGAPGRVYNITDDAPVTLEAFFWHLSQHLKKPMPPDYDPTAAGEPKPRKRAITNKKVSNARARAELGWTLQYPTYVEGYAEEIRRVVIDALQNRS